MWSIFWAAVGGLLAALLGVLLAELWQKRAKQIGIFGLVAAIIGASTAYGIVEAVSHADSKSPRADSNHSTPASSGPSSVVISSTPLPISSSELPPSGSIEKSSTYVPPPSPESTPTPTTVGLLRDCDADPQPYAVGEVYDCNSRSNDSIGNYRPSIIVIGIGWNHNDLHQEMLDFLLAGKFSKVTFEVGIAGVSVSGCKATISVRTGTKELKRLNFGDGNLASRETISTNGATHLIIRVLFTSERYNSEGPTCLAAAGAFSGTMV